MMPYRDLDDVERMLEAATLPGAKAVVIGGGLLGLEAAAGLAMRGMEVVVLHLMGHLMERQLDPSAGYLLQQDLERRGIKVHCKAQTKAILGQNRVEAVLLEDGTVYPADIVVMAVGIRPETRIATDAHLEVDRGIVVDDAMRTSDPDILAIGECVEHAGVVYGLVAPLYDQAKVVARTLLGEAGRLRAGRALDQAQGHRLRPLLRRRLRRRPGSRGDRVPRRRARRLQAPRAQGQRDHRRGDVRRHRRRRLVPVEDQGAGGHQPRAATR